MAVIIGLTVACLCFDIHAEENTVEFEGGDGSYENPFKVTTPAQLNNVRGHLDAYFLQTEDIDMTFETTNGHYSNGGSGWLPIGEATAEYEFTGTYDGGGHKVIGLTINRNTGRTECYAGLFGYVGAEGTIKNLGLEDVDVTGTSTTYAYTGGIAGYSKGTIINCYNTGNISSFYAGGIVGYNARGTIISCYNTGDISAFCAGGIVGINNGGIVKNSYNTGNISSFADIGSRAGGIVGGNTNNDSYITNCYNTGSVFSSSSGSSSVAAGGIAAYNEGTMTNCYNTGSISSFSSAQYPYFYVGGIAGNNTNNGVYSNSGTIKNCYNTGDVSSSFAASGSSYVGSVAGYSSGTIKNCYWNINAVQTANDSERDDGSKLGIGRLGVGTMDPTESKISADMQSPAFINTLNANRGTDEEWVGDSPDTNNKFPIFYYQFIASLIITPNIAPGIQPKSFNLELARNLPGFEIYYTTDETDPTESGILYEEAIYIDTTTTVKAVMKSGKIYSDTFEFKYRLGVNNINVDITSNADGSEPVAIISFYGKNGRLINLYSEDIPASTEQIKIMIWSCLQNMKTKMLPIEIN